MTPDNVKAKVYYTSLVYDEQHQLDFFDEEGRRNRTVCSHHWCRRRGCRGCKRTPKSFDLVKIRAKSLKTFTNSRASLGEFGQKSFATPKICLLLHLWLAQFLTCFIIFFR